MRSNFSCPQGIHSPRMSYIGQICQVCSLCCTFRAWFLIQSVTLKTDLVHIWKTNFKGMSRTLICYPQMTKECQVFLNLSMHTHRQLLHFHTRHRKISNNTITHLGAETAAEGVLSITAKSHVIFRSCQVCFP